MEIKVGEYVRTKKGIIAKCDDVINEVAGKVYCFDETIYEVYGEPIEVLGEDELEKYIKSHSFNIIDLIEKRRFCKWK